MEATRAWLIDTLILLPIIVAAFTAHELSHASVAVLLGDNTPRLLGRLSPNPLRHVDPFGLLMIILVGFGWARPVQYNPANLKRPAEHSVLIALAGPFSNLFLAFISMAVLRLLPESAPELVKIVVSKSALVNAGLFVFNLLPIPPLDGSHLIFWAIPDRFQRAKALFLKYGNFALLALILISSFAKVDFLFVGTMRDGLITALARLLGMDA